MLTKVLHATAVAMVYLLEVTAQAGRLLEVASGTLARSAGVRLALLFGSVARGTATATSDVDLALELAGPVDLGELGAALSLALGREIDLVVLDQVGVPLLEEIVRDAVVVYEDAPHAAARWRARALAQLETDRPWYARMRDAWLKRVAAKGAIDGQP